MSLIYWALGLDSAREISHCTGAEWYAASPLSSFTIILVLALGLAAAGLNLLKQNVMPWRTRFGLLLLRVSGFALLLLMLSRLELRLEFERTVRPSVAVLTDSSASMGLRDADGQTRLQAAREFSKRAIASLAARANVSQYSFDWQLKDDRGVAGPAGMTRLFEMVRETSECEDFLQAIVLLTDGNDTAGDQGKLLIPVLAARGLPVYPVVFGEPTPPRLARLKISSGAPYLRLGDELPLSATLSTTNLEEQAVSVRLLEKGRTEAISTRENVRIGEEPVEVRFVVKPSKVGEVTYRIVMEGVRGRWVSERPWPSIASW